MGKYKFNFETDRLFIRPILLSDSENLFEITSNVETQRTTSDDTDHTMEDCNLRILRYQYYYQNSYPISLAIVEKKLNKLIGTIGFGSFMPHHRLAEVGFTIHESFRGKGYAKEALTKIIHWAFNTLDFNRIEARCQPTNIASKTLLESLGFQQEGYLRKQLFFDNEFQDLLLFSLLHTEN